MTPFHSSPGLFSTMMQSFTDKPLDYKKQKKPSVIPLIYLRAINKVQPLKVKPVAEMTGARLTTVRKMFRKGILYGFLTAAEGSVRGKEITYIITQAGRNYIKEQLDGHDNACDVRY